MTPIEKRLLLNQVEIMWALHYVMGKQNTDLIGRSGELDNMRDNLTKNVKETRKLID